ncbi:cilia- and flagella-associated protein 54 [Xenentodon cancila]
MDLPATYYGELDKKNPVISAFKRDINSFFTLMKQATTNPNNSSKAKGIKILVEIWKKYKHRLPAKLYQEHMLEIADFLSGKKLYQLALWHGYSLHLLQFSSVKITDITDADHFMSCFFPEGFDKDHDTIAMKGRAMLGCALCIFELEKRHRILSQEGLCQLQRVLNFIRIMMQAFQQHEHLSWQIYNGSVHIYNICHYLMTMQCSAQALEYLLWASISLELSISLMIAKCLPLIVTLYCAVCQCYYDNHAEGQAKDFAKRALGKIHDLAKLEDQSEIPATRETQRAYKEASVKLGAMIFKQAVFETRRRLLRLSSKSKRTLRGITNALRPPNETERMLTDLFDCSAAQFLSILEALWDSTTRPLQTKMPDDVKRQEVVLELLSAGLRILSGENKISILSAVRFIKLLFQYKQPDVFAELAKEMLHILSGVEGQPFRKAERELALLHSFNNVMFCHGSNTRDDNKDNDTHKSPVSMSDELTGLVDTLQKTVCGSDPELQPDGDMVLDTVLFLWDQVQKAMQRGRLQTPMFTNYLQKMDTFDKWVWCLFVLCEVALFCEQAAVDYITTAEMICILGILLEKAAENKTQTQESASSAEEGKETDKNMNKKEEPESEAKSEFKGCPHTGSTHMFQLAEDLHLQLNIIFHRASLKLLQLNAVAESELLAPIKENKVSKALFLMQKALLEHSNMVSSECSKTKSLLEEASTLIDKAEMEERKLYTTTLSQKKGQALKGKGVSPPPPPILLSRTNHSFTFAPAPYNVDEQVCWYQLYGKVAEGVNKKVRLGECSLPGTGNMVPAVFGECVLRVEGLQPNQKYVFAATAYNSEGKLLGNAIGGTTLPLLASMPVPLLSTWAHLAQVAFQTQQFAVAKRACKELWGHYTDPNCGSNSTQHRLAASGLHKQTIQHSSPYLCQLFLTSIFIGTEINIQQGSLYCDSFSDSGPFIWELEARLAECEQMLVATDFAMCLNDGSAAVQAVVTGYGLLAPIIFHQIAHDRVVQVLTKCLVVLEQNSAILKQKWAENTSESLMRMIACITFYLSKALRALCQHQMAAAMMDCGTRLLQEYYDAQLQMNKPSNIAECRKTVAPAAGHMKISPHIKALHEEKKKSGISEDALKVKSVMKHRNKTYFLEFATLLLQRTMEEGHPDLVLNWGQIILKFLSRCWLIGATTGRFYCMCAILSEQLRTILTALLVLAADLVMDMLNKLELWHLYDQDLTEEELESSLQFSAALDDTTLVDLRWVRTLVLHTLERLHYSGKWESLAHFALVFNSYTRERYALIIAPLLVHAQRRLLERISHSGGPGVPQPHHVKTQMATGLKVTYRSYAACQLHSGWTCHLAQQKYIYKRTEHKNVIPRDAVLLKDAEMQRSMSLVCVPLDVEDTLTCYRQALEKRPYCLKFLQHSRSMLALLLAYTQPSFSAQLRQSQSRGLSRSAGQVEFSPFVMPTPNVLPCDLNEEDFSSPNAIYGLPISPDYVLTIAAAYSNSIKYLKSNGHDSLRVLALHEMGNLHFYTGNTREAHSCWSKAVDTTFQCSGVLEKWDGVTFGESSSQITVKQAGIWGCLQAAVLSAKIAQFILTSDVSHRTKWCLLSAHLFKCVLCCSMAQPQDDLEYATHTISGELLPGVDLFSEPHRVHLGTTVTSLNFICHWLYTTGYCITLLPVLALYLYFVGPVCRDVQRTVEGRILKVHALTELCLFTEALMEAIQLTQVTCVFLPHGLYKAKTNQKPLKTFCSSKSLLDNLEALEELVSCDFTPEIRLLYGPTLCTRFNLARVHLVLTLTKCVRGRPVPEKPEQDTLDTEGFCENKELSKVLTFHNEKEKLTPERIKSLLLEGASSLLSSVMQQLPSISCSEVEILELTAETNLLKASLCLQLGNAALSFEIAASSLVLLQTSNIIVSGCRPKTEKDSKDSSVSYTLHGDCPRAVEASERIGVSLWLRCRLSLVHSLVANIPGNAALIPGKNLNKETVRVILECVDECARWGDHDSQALFMVEGAELEAQRGKADDSVALLQQAVSLLSGRTCMPPRSILTLARATLLLLDLRGEQSTRVLQMTQQLLEKQLSVFGQNLMLVDGKVCFSPPGPSNIYLPYLDILDKLNIRIVSFLNLRSMEKPASAQSLQTTPRENPHQSIQTETRLKQP